MARARLADERDFIPANDFQRAELYRALVAQGTPVPRARGLIGWLGLLDVDEANNTLRTAYRRELARLGCPPWEADAGLGRGAERHQTVIRSKGAYHAPRGLRDRTVCELRAA